MADTREKQRLEARLADLRQSRQDHASKADEQGVQVCLHDGAIQECETWLAALDASVAPPTSSVIIATCTLGVVRIEHEVATLAQTLPLWRTFKRIIIVGKTTTDARNMAVKQAQDEGFDYLFFWDDDVIPHDRLATQHLVAVLDADPSIDLVGGIYPRKVTMEPIVAKDNGAKTGVWWGWRDGRAEQVYMTGTGFLVIRVSSLAKIPVTDGRYFEVDDKMTDDFFFADWCAASKLKWYAAGNVVCDQIDLDGRLHEVEKAMPKFADGIPIEELFPGAEVTDGEETKGQAD
ncbi:hypothetical protein LCGC14_1852520 [marine sediment metagenome]|uniref:Glycosyltransferase 2-like domain-containing protein n=1 Tax=marine sediment metagenome TaxID=412755 RepID=A0A0F9IPH4_9ZZZZ